MDSSLFGWFSFLITPIAFLVYNKPREGRVIAVVTFFACMIVNIGVGIYKTGYSACMDDTNSLGVQTKLTKLNSKLTLPKTGINSTQLDAESEFNKYDNYYTLSCWLGIGSLILFVISVLLLGDNTRIESTKLSDNTADNKPFNN